MWLAVLHVRDFVLYVPFAVGGAAIYAGFALARGGNGLLGVGKRAGVSVTILVALVLLGPYLQRFVTRVVDREGGGAAALSGLSIFITGAIAYVVFLGQQYESARIRAEEGMRQLVLRTNELEEREQDATTQEAKLADGLIKVEGAIAQLDDRVRHESLRAVAIHALESAKRTATKDAAEDQTARILRIILRDLVGRTTPASAEFDLVEVGVAVDELAAAGLPIDAGIQSAVSQYLKSLEGFADSAEQAKNMAGIRKRIGGLPSAG